MERTLCCIRAGRREPVDVLGVRRESRLDRLPSATLGVDGEPGFAIDLATLHPLVSRLPVWFEIESTATTPSEVRVGCTDGLHETGEAALRLSP